jgi:hypothetical protein
MKTQANACRSSFFLNTNADDGLEREREREREHNRTLFRSWPFLSLQVCSCAILCDLVMRNWLKSKKTSRRK